MPATPGKNRRGSGGRAAPPAAATPAGPVVPPRFGQFVRLSSALTGFSEAEIHGTGIAAEHFGVIPKILDEGYLGRLLTRWESIHTRAGDDDGYRNELILSELLGDPTLGPLAHNLAILWYLGMWYQLPAAWRQVHGAFALDSTHYVSARAYQESLVWKAALTHPPTAKQPGFGSWAMKPEGVK
jgi:hypothetical protein